MKKTNRHGPLPVPRLTASIPGWEKAGSAESPHVLGVLPGEGIGPEVINGALDVLGAVSECTPHRFVVRMGGKIGVSAERETGHVLPPDVVWFCQDVFDCGGAILCGPGGSRFVYELRTRFDLYCKLIPIQPEPALQGAGVFRPAAVEGVDILVVRENSGGIYFGEFGESPEQGGRRAYHRFHYDECEVTRVGRIATHLASVRRGRLCLVYKPAGLPSISALWRDCIQQLSSEADVDLELLEVDTANYRLIADAASFDVILAPNLFGDVLADGAAALLASRGMSYSANFSDAKVGVYQTAHGAAYDLAGQDRANPLGQVYSLAVMLRESFGLGDICEMIRTAVADVLAAGWRTDDIMEPQGRRVGTRELCRLVADALRLRCREHFSQSSNEAAIQAD